MFLSELRLIGFKSFANKTIIKFNNGITGIIGPNGCGKSNIVDAIKWVLGEQRYSSLRSSKSEDVIFNGTTNIPAQNIAEVSILIENNKGVLPSEYKQVEIKRRLYRTGESEYFINGRKVRLKDINDLFMDTGLGTHAYSIIEQQMIQDIISNKLENKKNIFDEAAGIMKYKERKKEALAKLKNNENDLLRLDDIISEIEKNVRSLKRQANKAQRFIEFKNILKEKEIKYYSVVSKSILEKIIPLENELGNFLKEKEEINTKFRVNDSNIEELSKKIIDLNNKFQIIQKNLSEKNRIYNKLKEEIHILDERIKNINNRIEFNKNELNGYSDKITQIENDIISRKESLEELGNSKVNLQKKLEDFEEQYKEFKKSYTNYKEQQQKLESEKNKLANEISNIENFVNNKNQFVTFNNEKLEALKTKKQQIEKSIEKLNNEREEFLKERNKVLQKLEEIEDENIKYESQITEVQEEKFVIEEEFLNITREIQKLKDKLELLNNSELFQQIYNNNEKSFKKFLENYNIKYHNIFDYIKPQEDFKDIILDILNYLNFKFIVDFQMGDEIFNNISSNLEGYIRFFINNTFSNVNFKEKEGFENIFPIINKIEYDMEYERIIKKIFGNCFWTEDITNLDYSKLSENIIIIDFKRNIIDLRNNVVQIFGKSKSIKTDSHLLFGRKLLIKQVEEDLGEKEKVFADLENKRNKIRKEFDKLKNIFEENKKQIEKNQRRLSEISRNLEILEVNNKNYSDELKEIYNEISKIKEEIKKIKDEVLLKEKELAPLKENYSGIVEKLNEFFKLNSENSEKLNKLDSEYQSLKMEVFKINEKEKTLNFELQSLQKSKKEIILNREKMKKQIEVDSEQITILNNEIKKKEKELQKLNEDRDDVYRNRNLIDDQLTKLNNKKDEIEKENKELRNKEQNILELIDITKNKIFNYKQELNLIKEKIFDKYKINILENDKEILFDNNENIDELKSEIEKLQSKLDSMGNINFEAVEEYTQQKERLDFYLTQREDLQNAKELLVNTINDINKTAEKQYLNTFSIIKDNFKKVFEILFQGGECDLVLDRNPDDPLDMDIQIIARPKGKKVKNLNLLSGGEKALTSLALLFSIYLVKPSPYCVLDEVDAPLDDANIGRFLNLLKEFSNNIQFIIITHNKKTMEAVDVLYGITMETPGVSKVVSVNLKKQGVGN